MGPSLSDAASGGKSGQGGQRPDLTVQMGGFSEPHCTGGPPPPRRGAQEPGTHKAVSSGPALSFKSDLELLLPFLPLASL